MNEQASAWLTAVKGLPDVHARLKRVVILNHDALDVIVRRQDSAVRIYRAHAGWGGGQLEGEMEAGGWLSTRATIDDVFADHETIWKTATQRTGLEIMAPELDREHVPPDPSMN
jgi:putative AlgH/UPF0301 family transcriptional regulator